MPENNSVLLNIGTMCRTCLKEKSADELRSLLDNDLFRQISEVANTQLSLSPSLPTSICNNCFKTLSIAVNFKKQIHNAESYFRKLICKEESDNVTVISESFTILDNGFDNSVGDTKDVAASEVIGNDDDVEQNVKQETIVLKEEDKAIYTDDVLDKTEESANYFTSHENEAIINASTKVEPAEFESTLPSVEINEIGLPDTDSSSNLKIKLQQNEETESPNGLKFKCNLCFMFFRFEFTYKKHFLNHGIPLSCELCLLMFYDSDEYLSHVKNVHRLYKPFTCPNCEQKFVSLASLKRHHVSHAQRGPKRFPCEFCGKKFYHHQLDSLTNHEKGHTGYKCDVCHIKLSCSHSLQDHLRIHDGQMKHKCHICSVSFIHRFLLRDHLREHTRLDKEKCCTSSNVCCLCNKKFASQVELSVHEKVHCEEEKHQCNPCNWRKSKSSNLQTNVGRATSEKPYACNQCKKSFKMASSLSIHKKTHLNLKNYVCSFCDLAFKDMYCLKRHIRIHIGKSHYQCNACGYRSQDAEKKPRIKKPLNAFMLYMKEMREKAVAESTLTKSAVINQILGRRWHMLSHEEQAKYYEKARLERLRHMQLYPDWSARDNYGYSTEKRKKRKKEKVRVDWEKVGDGPRKCRARYGVDQKSKWCKPCRRKKKCIRYTEDDIGNGENVGNANTLLVDNNENMDNKSIEYIIASPTLED